MKLKNMLNTARNLGNKVAVAATAMVASGAAMAQTVGADVEAAITAQQTIALAVAAAGTVAILIVKYSKLARRG